MVKAKPWPQQTITVLVRIHGIDTPELHSKCGNSRQLALAAKDAMAEALSTSGGELTLSSISGDKYFGHVVADGTFDHGHNAPSVMLDAGLARRIRVGRR